MVDAKGATERLVGRVGVRSSVAARTAIVAVCGLLGVFEAPLTWPTAAAVAVLLSWSVVFVTGLTRGLGRWVLPIDILMVSIVCLTQSWSVPADALRGGQGWVVAVASMTVVVYQWHTRFVPCLVAVAIVDGAFFAGLRIAESPTVSVATTMGYWLPVEAILSRLLWWLVVHGAQAADRAVEGEERVRLSAAVTAAARAAEREYSATLHDTAASTLLMVGLGEVSGAEQWLRTQARRDLAIFDDRQVSPDAEFDLVATLWDIVKSSRLRVSTALPDICSTLAAPGTALCQAVREALTNVERHARTGAAHVSLNVQQGELTVMVSDNGIGFLSEQVPTEKRGISESIVNRIAAVGGRASVISSPGAGTTIRMLWRHD